MRLFPEPVPEGALELLRGCHRRAERFVELAVRLPTVEAEREAVVDAAAAVHRYFTVAFPLHERDEEDSLLPLLRDRAIGRGALAVAERLAAEHAALDGMLERLRLAWLELSVRAPSPAERQALLEQTQAFRALLLGHAAAEEAELFPAAARVLSPGEREGLLLEFRERRAPRA